MEIARDPNDKLIKEKVLLRDCQKEDKLYIRAYGNGTFSGFVILVNIKPIPKNQLQIKYKKDYGGKQVVQKTNLPDDLMVERTRQWVLSDGEDAGYYPRHTQVIDGVIYETVGRREAKEETVEIPLDFPLPNTAFDQAMFGGVGMGSGLDMMTSIVHHFSKRGVQQEADIVDNVFARSDVHDVPVVYPKQEILPPLIPTVPEKFDPFDLTGLPTVGFGDPRASGVYGLENLFGGIGLSISAATGKAFEVNNRPDRKKLPSSD